MVKWISELVNDEFKERMKINRESFEYILNKIRLMIEITPTKMIGNPIESDKQLAQTLHRPV